MQGGQQSFEEAIHYKVPLIGLPFLIDQNANVRKMIEFGVGTGLDLKTLTKDDVKNAILKITHNERYSFLIYVISYRTFQIRVVSNIKI